MDSSYIGSANLSIEQKLNTPARTIHLYTRTSSTPTPTHSMVNLDLCERLSQELSFKLGFEIGQSGEISRTDRQQVPDRWSNETE